MTCNQGHEGLPLDLLQRWWRKILHLNLQNLHAIKAHLGRQIDALANVA